MLNIPYLVLHVSTALLLAAQSSSGTRHRSLHSDQTITTQLHSWAANNSNPRSQTAVSRCLVEGFSSGAKDLSISSQLGEDGILEFIFHCVGSGDKKYVEFGVETGVECQTRRLREEFGWSGLMMDGGNSNPDINLQQELIYAENIADLFKKHNVPVSPDLMVIDIDQNNFWIVHAVLSAGYTPRVLSAEYNRNFHPTQAYATVYLPDEQWPYPSCHFGASALAYERMLKSFGYSLVASDLAGANLFFVRNTEIGVPLPTSFQTLAPDYSQEAFQPIHGSCYFSLWHSVPADAPFTSPNLMETLPLVLLSHSKDSHYPDSRRMYEAQLPFALRSRQGCRAGLNQTLRAAEAAKAWSGSSGPVAEAQLPSLSGVTGCPARAGGASRGSAGSSKRGSTGSASRSSVNAKRMHRRQAIETTRV